MPTLWLAGQHDTKFLDIATRASAACDAGTARAVAGAGHTAHLEEPDAFLTILRHWFDGSET
ncbi:MAG: hypothetical protein U5R31_14315 [Acidimicrobiia bacterium]|nr:hypothetical protein [Acidimicrobiia bacterium]